MGTPRRAAKSAFMIGLAFLPALGALPQSAEAQNAPIRVFISVDMEGIGGIGTGRMTSANGKDYATGRELMTEEVNAVVAEIFAHGPAEVLVHSNTCPAASSRPKGLAPLGKLPTGNVSNGPLS